MRLYSRKSLCCLLLVFVALAPASYAADAFDEIDADWSPDMSDYRPAPQNWPLCGDISNAPGSTWSDGDSCGSTAADRVVSTYGPRPQSGDFDFHRGIDLRTVKMELDNDDLDDPADPENPCAHDCVPHRVPVFAIADGEVDEIEFKCRSGKPDGFRVVLTHEFDDGTDEYEWYTRYVHLSSVAALDSSITTPTCTGGSQTWEWTPSPVISVSAGEHIGYTGKSTSNNHHLHFEVRKDETWARSAVHPQRALPDAAQTASTFSLSITAADQAEVVVDGPQVDVIRVELLQGFCNVIAGEAVCTDFELVVGGQNTDGYLEGPSFFDYERSNYQYSHRGGSVWTNTSGFQYCPYATDHGSSYDSDLHLTADNVSVHAFNGTEIQVYGGVTPYKRRFVFQNAALPWNPTFEYSCLSAAAHSVDNGELTSNVLCRTTAGGAFLPLP